MLACCVLVVVVVVVVVVEQESLRLSVVFRNWFFVWFFVCFRVFLGFCGLVPEALCSSAQKRMQDLPAFRG